MIIAYSILTSKDFCLYFSILYFTIIFSLLYNKWKCLGVFMGTLDDDLRIAIQEDNSTYLDLDMFDFIYSRTNENISRLFGTVSVAGQDVYTVLSSSDYLFSIIEGGAKSVDTFDINPLTYRYYHLRKWLLQDGRIDAEGFSTDTVLKIVDKYFPTFSEEEKESAIFWTKYLSRRDHKLLYEDDIFTHVKMQLQNVPYTQDIDGLLEKLSNMPISFQRMNICKDIVQSDKKYDMVFLSNILDYNRNSAEKLNVAVSNLYRLLNSGGSIILSCFHSFLSEWEMNGEIDIFSSCFDYNELTKCNVDRFGHISYYQYVKKK